MVGISSEIQEKLQKKSKDFVLISSLKQPQLQAAVLQIKSQYDIFLFLFIFIFQSTFLIFSLYNIGLEQKFVVF